MTRTKTKPTSIFVESCLRELSGRRRNLVSGLHGCCASLNMNLRSLWAPLRPFVGGVGLGTRVSPADSPELDCSNSYGWFRKQVLGGVSLAVKSCRYD